jgi:hypothetical protein
MPHERKFREVYIFTRNLFLQSPKGHERYLFLLIILNLDALSRASKAFDDLILQGKRLNKIDEKMKDFVIKENLDMELKNFYTPLKSFNQLEENLYINYTKLAQFDDYKIQ